MTTIKARLSNAELEARYKTAVDPIRKSHFMRCGCCRADPRRVSGAAKPPSPVVKRRYMRVVSADGRSPARHVRPKEFGVEFGEHVLVVGQPIVGMDRGHGADGFAALRLVSTGHPPREDVSIDPERFSSVADCAAPRHWSS